MKTYSYLIVRTRVYDARKSRWDEHELKFEAIAEGGGAEEEKAVKQAEKNIEVLNLLGALGWKITYQGQENWVEGASGYEYTFIKQAT